MKSLLSLFTLIISLAALSQMGCATSNAQNTDSSNTSYNTGQSTAWSGPTEQDRLTDQARAADAGAAAAAAGGHGGVGHR